uniref:Uncharacterized protein n=1 Tax=Panagrolaimus sp. PS1159 TaxID=55785 RepID=A0AC35G2B9_9BILA
MFDSFTGGIANKLSQTNVKCIRMHKIPESFDIQIFVEFIKKESVYDYSFDQTISGEYVAKVKEICPYENIRTWYAVRIMTEEERIAYHRFPNDRGGQ